MRRNELPENSHRQRLATPGTAKTLRRIFLSLSGAQNRDASSRILDAGKMHRAVHCWMVILAGRRVCAFTRSRPSFLSHRRSCGAARCSAGGRRCRPLVARIATAAGDGVSVYRLIPVMLRLERSIDGNIKILRLLWRKSGEFDANFFQMKTCDFFVEFL